MPSTRAVLAGVAAVIAMCGLGIGALVARGDGDRTLSFYNIHTKETTSVVYMRGGKRDPEAMKKINWIMRDWRRNEATTMDPELIDLIWEVHAELGSKEPIHLISAYRSPGTNEALRRTQGGQAKNSRHTVGKAADIHFPDVPIRQLRYSGLVRQRGGVGYYPTSGVPFVHLDTGNVRHWPRVPRYELALLFPDGKSKHTPSDGRPLTRQDYVTAKSRYQELAQQVAAFFDLRSSPKTATTLVADAGGSPTSSGSGWKPDVASLPADRGGAQAVAAIAPAPARVAALSPVAPPRLVAEPRRVMPPGWTESPRGRAAAPSAAPDVKPAAIAAAPASAADAQPPSVSASDRNKLASLFSLASFMPEPTLLKPPTRVADEQRRTVLESLTGGSGPAPKLADNAPAPQPRVAAIDPASLGQAEQPPTLSDIARAGWSTGWAAAPEFDEEHPDEMAYRPFPVAPLLTETPSADDPVLSRMAHPKVRETLALLGKDDDEIPMRLRPGQQQVALLMAQQFRGAAVDLSALDDAASDDLIGQLARRVVTTGGR